MPGMNPSTWLRTGLTQWRRTLLRAERAIVRGYNFVRNVDYYLTRGYSLRTAIRLARGTL